MSPNGTNARNDALERTAIPPAGHVAAKECCHNSPGLSAMTAGNRRDSDLEYERIWRAIDALVSQVSELAIGQATHTAVCTHGEEQRATDARETKAAVAAIKASVDTLAKAAEDKAVRGRFIKRVSGWVGATGTAVFALWGFLEHAWPYITRMMTHQAVVALAVGSQWV